MSIRRNRATAPTAKKVRFLAVTGVLWLLFVLLLLFLQPPFIQRVDRAIYDIFLSTLRGGEPSPVPILVDIDEKSLQELGQWPWPRYRFAELLVVLYESGAASIGVDILMTEPDRTSPSLWASQMEQDFGVKPTVEGLPPELMDNDAYLASILTQIPVVMAAQVTDNRENEATSQPKPFPVNEMRMPGALTLADILPSGSGILMPMPGLAEAAPLALMNAEGDLDSIFRRVPLFLNWHDVPVPGLALATLALGAGDNSIVSYLSPRGLETVRVAGVDIPVSHSASMPGTMPVAFRGGGGVYPRYSAVDVLYGEVSPDFIADRVVFIGSTSAGLKDLRSTPFDNDYPGLELHAAVVDTILSERFIVEALQISWLSLIMILLSGLFSIALFGFAKPQIALTAGAVAAGAVWFGCRHIMMSRGLYVTPFYALLSLFLQAFSAFFLRFWLEEREKRVLRKAFSNYVSPEIVGQIMERGSVDSLRGEQRHISVLFTDLRGFTSLTEKMAPTQVVDMLGSYFSPMTAIVRDSMGTLDKFVGDALMAFWNAPLDVPDHACRAVQSLLDMHTALDELNRTLESTYGLRLRMGGGIHTGYAHVGNMGTTELMDYTAIGDTVNTASRLEGMCVKYGVGIVVSQDTVDQCEGRFLLKPLDLVKVKGRAAGIPIFTICPAASATALREEIDTWSEAFALYLKGNFRRSHALCSALADAHPGEKLYHIFMERTAAMSVDPPENWDGVFTYESK